MFCKNCGSEVNPDDKFCANCGTAIHTSDFKQASVVTKPQKVMKRLPFIGFSFLFLIISFFFTIFNEVLDRQMDAIDDPALLLFMSALCFIPAIVVFCYGYFCVARRLRDCGKNTYLAWLIIIPLVGFCLIIYLFIKSPVEKAGVSSIQSALNNSGKF